LLDAGSIDGVVLGVSDGVQLAQGFVKVPEERVSRVDREDHPSETVLDVIERPIFIVLELDEILGRLHALIGLVIAFAIAPKRYRQRSQIIVELSLFLRGEFERLPLVQVGLGGASFGSAGLAALPRALLYSLEALDLLVKGRDVLADCFLDRLLHVSLWPHAL